MNGEGKPRLTLLRVLEMNAGFFGLQLSFGLLVANSSPLFRTLGARDALLPLLWLAGPITGLIVQPLIGAISDRTVTRFGRRSPYIFLGAVLASLSLVGMPLAPVLWVAVVLLWVLDSANNMMLEPYRAVIVDRLAPDQHAKGFLIQSAFTGIAQTLAHVLPALLASVVERDLVDANGIPIIVRISFAAGAVIIASTVAYSLLRVPEPPLTPQERSDLARVHPSGTGLLRDIAQAVLEMPSAMRAMMLPMLCQWYAMFAFWQYLTDAVAQIRFDGAQPGTAAYREAIFAAQDLGTVYNFIAFLVALALIPLSRRVAMRPLHAGCLLMAALAMILMPHAPNALSLKALMVGIGIGWAALMANNHALLAARLPPQRTGIYMGLFNLFVVVPMFIETVTMPLLFTTVLDQDPARVLTFCGILMMLASASVLMLAGTRQSIKMRINRN